MDLFKHASFLCMMSCSKTTLNSISRRSRTNFLGTTKRETRNSRQYANVCCSCNGHGQSREITNWQLDQNPGEHPNVIFCSYWVVFMTGQNSLSSPIYPNNTSFSVKGRCLLFLTWIMAILPGSVHGGDFARQFLDLSLEGGSRVQYIALEKSRVKLYVYYWLIKR